MMITCKAIISLFALLCLQVGASRSKLAEVEQHVDGEEGETSKKRCSKTKATVEFNGFSVDFDINQRRTVGGHITLKCGPATGTPDTEVGFECKEDKDGVHYQKFFGWCKSKEQVKEESTPKCPAYEFKAEWTIDSEAVVLNFALNETKQPNGEDIPVTVPCPPGSPAKGKSATFTCRANATWGIKIEATKACLDLGGASSGKDEETEGGSGKEGETDFKQGGLPCKLEVKHVPLQGGKDGFELLVKCTEAIEDAKIKKFQDGLDLTVSGVEPNVATRITTQEIDSYLGRELVFVAKAGGEYKSTSVVVKAQEPLTPGSLPCRLSKEEVGLTSGETGFQVFLECEKPITGASLKIPGYAPMNFGDVGAGRYKLTTQDKATFVGKTFVLVGEFEGSEKSTNELVI